MFGLPASRPRVYCVGVLRGDAALDDPISSLAQTIEGAGYQWTGHGLDFFFEDQLFDLSQTA